jgi:Spy/CpxP family protein refolding chaperone
MRPRVKWLLTAALAVLVTSPLFGQLIPGLMPILQNGLDTPILLSNKGVRKEIKLTDEQYSKVHKIIKEVHDKYQPQLSKAQADGDKVTFVKLLADSTQETRERVNKALPDILSMEQAKRLKQIRIQVNGLISLNKPEVQKELMLTDKQKDEIKGIGDNLKSDIAGVVKDAAGSSSQRLLEKARKATAAVGKIKTLNEEATQKALAKLTEEQKKTWHEMTGDKFDFKLLDLQSRPRARP